MMYEILKKYPLCDRCFGRLFAKLLHATNIERGRALKIYKLLEIEKKINKGEADENDYELLKAILRSGCNKTRLNMEIKKESCPWCRGIFEKDKIERLLNKAINLLKEYDFNTFLIGTHLPEDIKELEEEIKTEYMESIKQEFGREFGKLLAIRLNKQPDKENPDIVVHINPYTEEIYLQVNPLFIKGRYRKLVRGISQTIWLCGKCKGKGCEICNYTGKKYPSSVEEIIAKPIMEATKGKDEKFHGAGREDVDVRMLGDGRPFIIEIKEPKIRNIDLKKIEEEINKDGRVEVLNLSFAKRKDVIAYKNTPHKKTYRALVECSEKVSEEDLKKLERELENRIIKQRTPKRVLHRRADLERIRKVYKVKTNKVDDNHFEMIIYCDGGLYIKELISGDDGRTKPSVSSILNKPCICKELDVLKVHDNETGDINGRNE
ncbi:pseudouridylate synthase [Methanocaldococcus villosus KIN24-T80]|uniref:tRNA pseudouridine synthase Pus10 n=1 Tax=Methanocaldococcus villosus KIN24-T80 TaxID=1069083 RepID=N6W017_9EURY|nr:tRNA pseudouridine(54/55) synthase Pus10 [Methanocaldococcus villosus]ENN96692.1 pseudouridylate synthase [Methanocaldococcus villosus KIN24-T80]